MPGVVQEKMAQNRMPSCLCDANPFQTIEEPTQNLSKGFRFLVFIVYFSAVHQAQFDSLTDTGRLGGKATLYEKNLNNLLYLIYTRHWYRLHFTF